MELFIIHVKFAMYYFLHFNKVRQVAARLRAKSAIYDCLVTCYIVAWQTYRQTDCITSLPLAGEVNMQTKENLSTKTNT